MEVQEKTPDTKPSEEGQKPKIVRNRDVDKAAKELQDDHILPLPPGKVLTWDQMEEYLGLLSPAMWSHLSCYLYRLKPKIRRQLRDVSLPNYIDCFGEPFSMDHIMSRHGGGKYQIQATDVEGKHGVLVFKCHFDINDAQYPPILDYKELDQEARENKSYIEWLKNKGILNAKGEVVEPGQPAPPASNATNLSAKEVLDILGFATKMSSDQQAAFRQQFAPGTDSLSKSVGEILLEKMKQDDPGKDWDRMAAFMDRIHKPDGSIGAIVQMMQAQITSSQEQRKTDLAYLQMILDNQKRDREPTPRSQFAELREIIGFVREILPAGGKGVKSGWDTGIEIARDLVLPGLQTIGTTITNIMSLNKAGHAAPGTTAASGAVAPVGPFDPYKNPGAAKAYASSLSQQPQPQPAPGQAPPPPMPPPAPAPAPQPEVNAVEAQLFNIIAPNAALVINHLNADTPGYDFADYLSGLFGRGIHAQLISTGENALFTVMMRIPEIAVFGESKLRTFVNEFVHFDEYMQAQADEEIAGQPAVVNGQPAPPAPEPATASSRFYKPPQKAANATNN